MSYFRLKWSWVGGGAAGAVGIGSGIGTGGGPSLLDEGEVAGHLRTLPTNF